MRESCLQEFDAHWQCLEKNNQYFQACRKPEKTLNDCVFTKLVRQSLCLHVASERHGRASCARGLGVSLNGKSRRKRLLWAQRKNWMGPTSSSVVESRGPVCAIAVPAQSMFRCKPPIITELAAGREESRGRAGCCAEVAVAAHVLIACYRGLNSAPQNRAA